MSLKISVNNEQALKVIDNLKSKLKPEVIDKGLDAILAKDLAILKVNLLAILNKEATSKVISSTQDLGQTEIKLPKSDEELIKHITGVDLTKVTKTKDFNTLADGKLAVISNKTSGKAKIDQLNEHTTSPMSSGVNLRLPMNEYESFESQYSQAINYYNNATFVFVDNNGKANYYLNPGVDITRHIKVVCSKETGNTEKANERWEKHRDKRGFADWTLLSSGVDAIKRDFINITDIIDKIKTGDYEDAKGILNRVSQRSSQATDLFNKIDNLKNEESLTPSVKAYNNAVKLIKNLKLEKTVKKDRTSYTLVSTFDENTEDFQKFQEKMQQTIKLWKISNEKRLVRDITLILIDFIKKTVR
jgi:tetratricopeptide (TPR) repeat protein